MKNRKIFSPTLNPQFSPRNCMSHKIVKIGPLIHGNPLFRGTITYLLHQLKVLLVKRRVTQLVRLYSPDWANTCFSFIFLTVNLFRHPKLSSKSLHSTVYLFGLYSLEPVFTPGPNISLALLLLQASIYHFHTFPSFEHISAYHLHTLIEPHYFT